MGLQYLGDSTYHTTYTTYTTCQSTAGTKQLALDLSGFLPKELDTPLSDLILLLSPRALSQNSRKDC